MFGDPGYSRRSGFMVVRRLVLPGPAEEYFHAKSFEGCFLQGEVAYHEAFSARGYQRVGRVTYLECRDVIPETRRLSIGRALVVVAETWCRDQGCVEFASDVRSENKIGILGRQPVLGWVGIWNIDRSSSSELREWINGRSWTPIQKKAAMDSEILKYNKAQEPADREICDLLAEEIDRHLPGADSKIWHRHPVWFLNGNPTVGYGKQKPGIRLMFWSGADFEEAGLDVVGKKFKDASIFYNGVSEVEKADIRRWLRKAQEIQWDYRNLVKRKGRLERLE